MDGIFFVCLVETRLTNSRSYFIYYNIELWLDGSWIALFCSLHIWLI
uniref:Uncharacterized protein n=1 Tax=Arundo donax TaxID=35708 RepID=A0A0A9GEZ8_ARUDO